MRRRRRGLALIATLGVLAVLMVMAASFAVAVQTETRLAGTDDHRTAAYWLAEAGLQRALVELRDASGATTLYDPTATDDPLVMLLDTDDEDLATITDGRYRVSVVDENARVDLNHGADSVLEALLPDEAELADAILDWRDKDDAARPSGAESDYYAGLTEPYQVRNGPFGTPGELLLVRDVSPARFYGNDGLSPLADPQTAGAIAPDATPLRDQFTVWSNDVNADADGRQRLDVTTADRDTLTESLGDVLSTEDVDKLVAYREDSGTTPENQDGLPAELQDAPAEVVTAVNLGAAASGTPSETPGAETDPSEKRKRPETVAELVKVIGREKLRSVYDRLTVSEDSVLPGLINVNTAPVAVLAALPGMDAGLAEAVAAARVEQPFETVGDLLGLTEMSDDVFVQVAPLLTVRSGAFRIVAQGVAGEGNQAAVSRVEAVVVVDWQPAERATSAAPATDEAALTAQPTRTLRIVYRRVE